jgi:cell division protein FtsB
VKRARARLTGLFGAAALVAVVVAAAGIFPFRQIIAQERAVDLAQVKLEALQTENDRLERQIVALQTDDEVERIAREQFGLVRPGETGFVVVAPPGETTTTVPTEPVIDRSDRQPWWRDLWDFLTGRDLLSDG